MTGTKNYLQPQGMIFNAMLGLMELQNGKERVSDPMHGELYFDVVLFGICWKLGLHVTGMDNDRCCAKLTVSESGKAEDDESRDVLESMIQNEFALLDHVLLAGTPQTIIYDL